MPATRGAPQGSSNAAPAAPSAKERQRLEGDHRLRAAMDVLLAGKSKRTDGTLTAENVALEAGMARASLYRPHRKALLGDWRDRLRALREEEAPALPQEEARRLREELRAVRAASGARIRELEDRNNVLAQQVQYLTLAVRQLQTTGGRATGGDATAVVIPLSRGHRSPGGPGPAGRGPTGRKA